MSKKKLAIIGAIATGAFALGAATSAAVCAIRKCNNERKMWKELFESIGRIPDDDEFEFDFDMDLD